jgi:ribulose-5-phosphate 4-epimerase/fuculose-1-phosphate aldolase
MGDNSEITDKVLVGHVGKPNESTAKGKRNHSRNKFLLFISSYAIIQGMANEPIRNDLALAYQIMAELQLDDHTYTHLSSRAEGNEDAFFIYPFGYRFEEVTPECLLKVSFDGIVLEGSEHQYNKTGYTIHGGIYRERPDINHVFHTHTPENVAVSSMKRGLLPISQWALHFYDRMSYTDYNSLALNEEHGCDIVKSLGDNYAMLMRNHGAITCGRTIQEAMFYTYHLEKACKAQCLALSSREDLILPSKEICEKSAKDLLGFEADLGLRDWNAWKRKLKGTSFT